MMKFTIHKSDIVDVLGKVQGLTGRRSSLAVTECVLIQADENGIHITATDLETGFEGRYPAVVESPGTIAISARKFYEIIREFPSPDVLVDESENRWINIGNQKVQYHLMAMNPKDFPDTPTIEALDFFEVEAGALKKMIDKSIIISGIGEDKKAHINGVWFERLAEHEPPIIRMVSTDGSRLSKYDLVISGEGDPPAGDSVLVPKKGLHEISKFLNVGGKILVAVQGSYFVIKSEKETFYVRLLEGQFPQYDQIIFRDNGHAIEMEKEPFLSMLKRMSILCTDSYRAAMFRFDTGEFVINATNPDIGESKEDMAIDYQGQRFEAAFNPKFFIEAVNNIDEKNIIIDILSEDKPCLISGVEDKSYLNAIMPMRV